VSAIREQCSLNESRACGLVGITRWINRYQSRRDSQADLRMRLPELAGSRVRYGYRRLTVLLRREGRPVNAKRVYRMYREEGLQVRTKPRAKRAAQISVQEAQARAAVSGARAVERGVLTVPARQLDRWNFSNRESLRGEIPQA
jgi:transposase InsO family protein